MSNGDLGNLKVVSADNCGEFIGRVIEVRKDSPPNFPENQQYHLLVQPEGIEVKGSTGCFHIYIRIPPTTIKTGGVVEGSVLYRYVQEIQAVLKEARNATTIDEVFEMIVNKKFLFQKQVLGQSYKGHDAVKYPTPKRLIENGE